MSSYQTLQLKPNEERRLLAGHLWIYSNEIDTKKTPLKNFAPGELITLVTSNGKFLGTGYINPNTLLCARLLTRIPHIAIDEAFFIAKINAALSVREKLFPKPFYRLIFGESDGIPGVIVDRFADTLVVQLNSYGIDNLKTAILNALTKTLNPKTIILKNDSGIRELEGLTKEVTVALGEKPTAITLEENQLRFQVAPLAGQKTGWFYDQRQNRARVASYTANQKVLDVFSYVGGFALNAAYANAKTVTCIDSSKPALDLLQQNAKLNNLEPKITCINQDAFSALQDLRAAKQTFDVIILDPPALVKNRKDLRAAQKAYQNLNTLALQLLNHGGILASFSCSLHLSRDDLLDTIRRAALTINPKQDNTLTVIEQLHQDRDHPVHPAIDITNYLKGFILHYQ